MIDLALADAAIPFLPGKHEGKSDGTADESETMGDVDVEFDFDD